MAVGVKPDPVALPYAFIMHSVDIRKGYQPNMRYNGVYTVE